MVALACALALRRRQRGHPAPMLPVDLLRRPLFALSALTSMASFTTQGLAFVALPFYFERVLLRPPVETGFLMLPWAVVVTLAAPLAGRLSERYRAGWLGGIGLVTLSVGMLLLALLKPGAASADIAWRMALCGAGFGLFQSPNNHTILTVGPAHRSGGASGMLGTARLSGQTIGATIVALSFALLPDSIRVAMFVAATLAAVGAVLSALRVGRLPR